MAISTRRKLMLTKAILFVVGGTFLIVLLQLYYLEEPLEVLSFQIFPMQEPLQIYAEDPVFFQNSSDLQGPLNHRLHFKGTNDTLWDASLPTQECEAQFFPDRHWTAQSKDGAANGTGWQMYGSVAAQQAIWSHQHPSSCSDKKFIVYEALGPEHGIGSILHAIGVALQAALDLDRVLVLYPQPEYEWVNGWFCQGTSALDDCYFEPLSSCTVADAFGNNTVDLDNLWRFSELSMESYHRNESDTRFSEQFLGSSVRRLTKNFETSKNIFHALRSKTPHMFHTLLQDGNLTEKSYYWWRAQSVAYIVRPNNRTLHELFLRRNFFFTKEPLEQGTISVHVPYGHQLKDNRTANNAAYLQSAEGLVRLNPHLQRKIFLSTEDPETIRFFAKQSNWTVMWTNVTRIANSMNTTDPNVALNAFATRFGWDEEFLNSLLSLELALECDGFVGELSSNWNRLIDELRSTVRCKFDRVYVDVVQGFNVSNHFW